MANYFSNKLALVQEIINEGTIEDAFQLVKDIEILSKLFNV